MSNICPVSDCESTELERRCKIINDRFPFIKSQCLQTEMSIFKMLAVSCKLTWRGKSSQMWGPHSGPFQDRQSGYFKQSSTVKINDIWQFRGWKGKKMVIINVEKIGLQFLMQWWIKALLLGIKLSIRLILNKYIMLLPHSTYLFTLTARNRVLNLSVALGFWKSIVPNQVCPVMN